MITPVFVVMQDDTFITIKMKTPYIKVNEIEIYCEGPDVSFYAKPYYLRLHFSNNLIEDDRMHTSYDISNGDVIIKLAKENTGEYFPDLDFLTKLLAPRARNQDLPSEKPLIEVIGEDINGEDSNTDKYDWELPQEFPDEKELVLTAKYGFNGLYSGYFTHVKETYNEINEINDPERSTAQSPDFMQVDEFIHLTKYKTKWSLSLEKLNKIREIIDGTKEKRDDDLDIDEILEFTEQECKIMRSLPNKQYLIDNVGSIYYGLIDLIFAYSYNHRINEGENNVESVWTIGKISPTISCLEVFNNIEELILSLFHRTLAYPLYRNFELSKKCLEDVYVLLELGRRAILKVLLELKDLFDHHDTYYIYSKIILDDYCIWCQNMASPPKIIWNSGQQTFKLTNRVIMLIGLDPNSTPGLIKKSFEAHDLKVSVDYRRDDTTGYVHLNLQMAKEVAAHIMAKGGLKVGIDEAMYWGVYSGTRSIGSKTTNQYKTIGGKARHTRRYHKHSPYLTNFKNIEIGDDIEDQQQKHHINKCHTPTHIMPWDMKYIQKIRLITINYQMTHPLYHRHSKMRPKK
nr:7954_t:CDS:10 [Entrophospora candida]